jgi:hypothetical protein
MKSVTERLADKFGGQWKFNPKRCEWVAVDGRVVWPRYLGVRRYWLFEPSGNSYEITL